MKKKFWLLAVLTTGLFQSAFAQINESSTAVKTTTDKDAPRIERSGYLVGPGDVITGKVLGESQFDFTATIDEDGKFQVPFFEKSIMAKCRTERELRSDVTQLLAKYLKNPLVGVSVSQRNSRPKATIYGEVRAPQQVTLEKKVRLLELLAFAGGVNTERAGGTIQVFHTQPPMCEESYEDGGVMAQSGSDLDFPYRIYSLNTVQQGSPQSNPIIYPGDIIVVNEAKPVFITGQVLATGKLLIPEGGLSLRQALASIGGIQPTAKSKDIKIYRLKANSQEREIISVNYDLIRKGEQKDVMLSPYDIVEVDKAKKSIAQTILDIAMGTVRGTVGVLPQTVLR
ncbi:MAG TPA: SLBB domain-containing protein [Pyrinomonadaceae bacterium]|nr:SLBB domain-containing protein [Pyrinomonadaceae bacterium]